MQEAQADITKLSERINALGQEKSSKKQTIIAYVMATAALIAAIVQYFV